MAHILASTKHSFGDFHGVRGAACFRQANEEREENRIESAYAYAFNDQLDAIQEIAELDVLRGCFEHKAGLRSEVAWY